jgi:hypothetical protein
MVDRVRNLLEATNCATLDVERNRRIESFARQLAASMRQEGSFFSIREAADKLHIAPEDLLLVKERVYELTLKSVFKKYLISGTDRTGLQWIGKTLRLTPEESRRIELRVGRRVFEEYLAFSISCGFLDEPEMSELRAIAQSLEVPTRDLLLSFLAESGEQFLRRILTGLAQDGEITDEAWGRLAATTTALGVGETELITLLRPAVRALALTFQKERLWDNEIPIGPLKRLAQRFDRLRQVAAPATRTGSIGC